VANAQPLPSRHWSGRGTHDARGVFRDVEGV